jgi:hypothetical protein
MTHKFTCFICSHLNPKELPTKLTPKTLKASKGGFPAKGQIQEIIDDISRQTNFAYPIQCYITPTWKHEARIISLKEGSVIALSL